MVPVVAVVVVAAPAVDLVVVVDSLDSSATCHKQPDIQQVKPLYKDC